MLKLRYNRTNKKFRKLILVRLIMKSLRVIRRISGIRSSRWSRTRSEASLRGSTPGPAKERARNRARAAMLWSTATWRTRASPTAAASSAKTAYALRAVPARISPPTMAPMAAIHATSWATWKTRRRSKNGKYKVLKNHPDNKCRNLGKLTTFIEDYQRWTLRITRRVPSTWILDLYRPTKRTSQRNAQRSKQILNSSNHHLLMSFNRRILYLSREKSSNASPTWT